MPNIRDRVEESRAARRNAHPRESPAPEAAAGGRDEPPTAEQIETSLRRIATGKVRRCIPVEPDDDDVVLSNAIEHLRAALSAAESRAEEAERERDEAREQVKAFTALRVKRLNMESREDRWTADMVIGVTPEAREAFAVMVSEILDSTPGATNYLEMRVIHPEGREYAVTCQRVEGKTPAQKAAEAEARAAAAERALSEARGALGAATPTPVWDVLDVLAGAAEHLLRDHDCDQHGWEGVGRRVTLAREYAAKLRALSASPPPETRAPSPPSSAPPGTDAGALRAEDAIWSEVRIAPTPTDEET